MTRKLRNVPFSPPDMTESEANEVKDAILSGWITTGPRTKKLEKLIARYVGVNTSADVQTPNCVCLNSQTACAEMALRLLGVGAGDEVIVPAYTYTASASIVDHVGAKVIFVDIQKDSLEMDYNKVEAAITQDTKAIIPVDLAGIPCDYDRLFEIVNRKKDLFQPKTDLQSKIGRVAICADCAHSFGASRKGVMAGAMADFSSFSFHAVKNFTTAEGGALTWKLPFGDEIAEMELDADPENTFSCLPQMEGETWNRKLYRITQLLSLHGQNKDALAKTKLGAWEYDIVGPWFKCNMTDVVAALGLIQFKRYPEMLAKRKKMIARYEEALSSLGVKGLRHYTEEYVSSGHLYICRLEGMNREKVNGVIEQMAEMGVATNVHYKPLPMMTAYMKMGFDIKDFPNAFAAFDNEITLPLNTKMTEEDLEYVIDCMTEVLKGQ
ncbi:MAG: DegT/DnrJ/EryC1/StrS family aminotransferase [Bacteroides sp.]|nr:DegT/DnrJ/EryC1/StrS family aminotransferase [Bacteroides sp.]MCM1446703.1 DegT/DnrJ/EryC1/StrS family aminotransferase [Bacteroides sp.]